jgi:hypothetical protein
MAALYQNELYELVSGRAGISRLQSFGVSLGHSRVVIYLAPNETFPGHITTNTARTNLLFDREPLPWAEWAEKFRQDFPTEIKDLMDSVSRDRQESDYAKSIRERLKDIEDLLKLKKYRPSPNGPLQINPDPTLGAPRQANENTRGGVSGSPGSGKGGSRSGDLYTLFLKDGAGIPGREVRDRLNEINVQWVSEAEVGVSDRAATYISETNTLLINRDFRVFTEFIVRWEKQYREVPGAKSIITEVAREWFQQGLTEVVYSVDFLKGGKQWTDEEVKSVLSPEALTAAVLPRYHIEMAGQKLGSTKERSLAAV